MVKRKKQRPRRLEGDWDGQVTLRGERIHTRAKMFHRGHLVVGVSINDPADRSFFFAGREDGKTLKGSWWRIDMKTEGSFTHALKERGRRLEGTISIKGSKEKIEYVGRRR
jgi:hypothetical protein